MINEHDSELFFFDGFFSSEKFTINDCNRLARHNIVTRIRFWLRLSTSYMWNHTRDLSAVHESVVSFALPSIVLWACARVNGPTQWNSNNCSTHVESKSGAAKTCGKYAHRRTIYIDFTTTSTPRAFWMRPCDVCRFVYYAHSWLEWLFSILSFQYIKQSPRKKVLHTFCIDVQYQFKLLF